MRYRAQLFLLVVLIVSACTARKGDATPALPPTAAPSLTARSPALPTQTEMPFTAQIVTQPPTVASTTTPTAHATITPGPPTPTAMQLPTRVSGVPEPQPEDGTPSPTLLDQYLPERELAAETEHFRFYSQDGYFPVEIDWLVEQAEVVYGYVSDRLDGAQVENKIELAFTQPDQRACPVRGLASHARAPQVLLYADENTPRDYLLAVLAHEVGHAIPSEGFPGGLPDELALTEGLATWASGKYWDAWKNVRSIHQLVHGYVQAGEYEPIHQNVDLQGIYPWQDDAGPDCLVRRDKVYSEWGSFLGYLIGQYGWEDAHRLFTSRVETRGDQRIEYPPDYVGIYGKALNQLEFDWLSWLEYENKLFDA